MQEIDSAEKIKITPISEASRKRNEELGRKYLKTLTAAELAEERRRERARGGPSSGLLSIDELLAGRAAESTTASSSTASFLTPTPTPFPTFMESVPLVQVNAFQYAAPILAPTVSTPTLESVMTQRVEEAFVDTYKRKVKTKRIKTRPGRGLNKTFREAAFQLERDQGLNKRVRIETAEEAIASRIEMNVEAAEFPEYIQEERKARSYQRPVGKRELLREVRLMPTIPFYTDDESTVEEIVEDVTEKEEKKAMKREQEEVAERSASIYNRMNEKDKMTFASLANLQAKITDTSVLNLLEMIESGQMPLERHIKRITLAGAEQLLKEATRSQWDLFYDYYPALHQYLDTLLS